MRISLPRKAAYEVFNRAHKVLQRQRAANDVATSRKVEYLRDEVANRTMERLAFVSRKFDKVIDLGSGAGSLEKAICSGTEDANIVKGRFGEVTMVDSCKEVLYRDADLPFNKEMNVKRLVADEETFWPGESQVDAVISSMSLHWINDLPGVLKRVENMLKPDGMFMANMIGGDSLYELRTSLQLAEQERFGRISPRLSPLADVKDMGALMQQAKYKLLTIDVEDIIVNYPDMFALMDDLKAMGENNAVKVRPSTISRDVLQAANSIYTHMHGDEDGSVPATFRIIYIIGWKYSQDQPKPLERGSADVSFKDILPQLSEDGK